MPTFDILPGLKAEEDVKEVWVTPQDQRDLAIVTGKDRDGWLDQRPLWICEDGVAA